VPRLLDALVGGWELTGQYQIQSGIPVVFSTNSFFSGVDPALPGGGTLSEWFDTSQFFPFPSKNTDISAYPPWTGIQNLSVTVTSPRLRTSKAASATVCTRISTILFAPIPLVSAMCAQAG